MIKFYILFFTFNLSRIRGFDLNNTSIPNSNCSLLKNAFANFSAEFTLCAIGNSRPITICEQCLDSYWNVKNSYTNMSKEIKNGTSCLDTLINADRLQIVYILYKNNVDLWSRAKCGECYESDNSKKISNQTHRFQLLYHNFNTCINTTKDNLCPTCMQTYVELDNYYKSISNVNDKISICMDLVDIMNNTWTFWSTNCCKYRRHNEYIFIVSTVVVLVITIAFYLIVQFYKEKNAPTIVEQSRFFASLNIFRN